MSAERKRPGLSIVLPAFNEEANIAASIRAMGEAATAWFDELEIIVVDDGSRDATAARVGEIAATDPRVRLLRHPVNRGYGASSIPTRICSSIRSRSRACSRGSTRRLSSSAIGETVRTRCTAR